MAETKSILMSRTFWSAMLAAAGFVLHWFGVEFPESEQATVADQILGAMPYVMEIVGTVGVIIGRMRADKAVTLTGRPKGDVPHGGGVQAPWWSVLGAAGLALLLMGCGFVSAVERFEAANCSQTPLERAQNRQALIDTMGLERARLLFVTCRPGDPGYHEALDGPADDSHPLLE